MTDSDRIRLQHMLASAREAVEFRAGRQRDEFMRDRMAALAVIRCMEVVGEAASQISLETRQGYPSLPWADIVGMRNRLIHGYFDVDMRIVWDTPVADLPPLIATLEEILRGRP